MTVTQSISGKFFSANIPDMVIAINGGSAVVGMKIDDEEIYKETLFPIGGKIEITDLTSLVTPYAQRKLICTLKISIAADSTTITNQCDVVFCKADVNTPCADFCENHFLTLLLGMKKTALGRLEYLHYIGTEAAQVTAHYKSMRFNNFQLSAVGGNDKYTTIDVSPAQFEIEGEDLIYYEVKAGERSMVFEMDFSEPDCAPILIFVNSFGVEELLYCTGTHKVSPTYKRDTMYIRSLQRLYNLEETRSFTADTGVMSFEEALWAEEIFRSEQIRVVNFLNGHPNVGKEIIITDGKPERTNDADELPRFAFTYQYAQRNHNVMDLQREGRIFDNTFDNTFN